MLGKLIKHEFKATARYFLPIFLVVLIMTPITKFITSLDIFEGYLAVIPGFFIFVYVLTLFGVAVVAAVVIIMRFYKNLISTEGYLMHTLPVKPYQHIISKMLVAAAWSVISLIIILLSLFTFFIIPDHFDLLRDGWNMIIQDIQNDLGPVGRSLLTQTVITGIIGIFSNILFVYVSIAIGQVISRHKIVGAIAASIVLNIITQILSLVMLVPIIFLGVNINDPSLIVNWIFPLSIVLTLVVTIGYFFGTNYVLKKKLNLE